VSEPEPTTKWGPENIGILAYGSLVNDPPHGKALAADGDGPGLLSRAWRQTEIRMSSKVGAIVYHRRDLRTRRQSFS
jgi:hypothetical protein